MTQMSEPTFPHAPAARANCPSRQGAIAMARPLHAVARAVAVLLVPLLLVACVIPPSLGVEQGDASVNSPPAITSIRADTQSLSDGQTISFTQGMGSIAMELLDTDVGDMLFVKVFVDYNHPNPTPPRSTCTGVSSGNAKRTATCDLTGLCLDADINVDRQLEVDVFDRMVQDVGTPLYKSMAMGGLTTQRAFVLRCLPK
jgi:hypothetical protein